MEFDGRRSVVKVHDLSRALPEPPPVRARTSGVGGSPGEVLAPIPGNVLQVLVEAGHRLERAVCVPHAGAHLQRSGRNAIVGHHLEILPAAAPAVDNQRIELRLNAAVGPGRSWCRAGARTADTPLALDGRDRHRTPAVLPSESLTGLATR